MININIEINMPFLNSLFNCSSHDDNESNIDLIRDIETGKAERLFMREQLEDLRHKVNDIGEKAIKIFGVEKDIAVMNSNILYIKEDLKSLKEELRDIKNLINKLN